MSDLVHEEVPHMLTYRQAATFLGVPVGTLYAWVHTRTIPHVRLGPRLVRFSRANLLAWVDARAITANGEVSP